MHLQLSAVSDLVVFAQLKQQLCNRVVIPGGAERPSHRVCAKCRPRERARDAQIEEKGARSAHANVEGTARHMDGLARTVAHRGNEYDGPDVWGVMMRTLRNAMSAIGSEFLRIAWLGMLKHNWVQFAHNSAFHTKLT